MGRAYVPPPDPDPDPDSETQTQTAVPGDAAGKETVASPLRLGGNLIDRFITIFQLGIGLVLLLSSDFFHFGENANIALAELGISQKIPLTVDRYGWLVLAANIVLLLATFVWAYATLRRGRLAFYIPVVGYIAFSTMVGVLVSVLR
jgi:hypothetical protein